jgi:hypothetical protein
MSTFESNFIKVIQLHYDKLKRTLVPESSIVFLGNIPEKVLRAAELYKRGNPSATTISTLQKYFGKNFKKRLRIDDGTTIKGGATIKGGFSPPFCKADNPDAVGGTEHADISSHVGDELGLDDDQFLNTIEFSDVDFATTATTTAVPITQMSDAQQPAQQPTQPPAQQPTQPPAQQPAQPSGKPHKLKLGDMQFSTMDIFEYDTVFEFKSKLAIELETSIYKLHLFQIIDGHVKAIGYKIKIDGYFNPNIQNAIMSETVIEGIPINEYTYNTRNYLQILALDTFTIMSDVYESDNIGIFYSVNLDEFMGNYGFYEEVLKDAYKSRLVYWGFVALFWPMLTEDVFKSYLFERTTFAQKFPELEQDATTNRRIFQKQTEIMEIPLVTPKDALFKNIVLSITSCTMLIKNVATKTQDANINLRNLFDMLHVVGTDSTAYQSEQLAVSSLGETVGEIAGRGDPDTADTADTDTNPNPDTADIADTDTNPDPDTPAILSAPAIAKSSQRYTNNIVFVRAKLVIGDRMTGSRIYLLSKTRVDSKSMHKDQLSLNSITIGIRSQHEEDIRPYVLTITSDGACSIRGMFRRELKFGFEEITRHLINAVNPIITLINNYPAILTQPLPLATEHNISFTNVNLSFGIETIISDQRFETIKNIWQRFINADIILDGLEYGKKPDEYLFHKGIHGFDPARIEQIYPLNNYYKYLSDAAVRSRWFSVFPPGRTCRLVNKHNELYVDIDSIIEREFKVCREYILRFFYKVSLIPKDTTMAVRSDRKLARLKQEDPELYKFREYYGQDIEYSRMCQKPKQPLLHSYEEFVHMPKGRRERLFRYWNFTKKEPAFYECPNPKYPHIGFLVGLHPKHYCIPCCKKIAVREDNTNMQRLAVHNACAIEHVYDTSKRIAPRLTTLFKTSKGIIPSKYVITYGKEIDIDRLSKLPPSMEALFADAIDSKYGFYILGVSQISKNGAACGMLEILILAICAIRGIQRDEAINIIYNTIRDIDDISIISNIPFQNVSDLSNSFNHTFIKQNLLDRIENNPNWNTILLDIAIHALGYQVYVFEDNTTISLTSAHSKISTSTPIIFVIKRGRDTSSIQYFPICLVSTEQFFADKEIKQVVFSINDPVFSIIDTMVKVMVKSRGFNGPRITDLANLCTSDTAIYKIKKQYITAGNMCYGMLLLHKDGHRVFVPTLLSDSISDLPKSYKPFLLRKNPIEITKVLQFLADFKRYKDHIKDPTDLHVSAQLIYANKMVGIIVADMNWYCVDTSGKYADKYSKQNMIYHPDDIANAIHEYKRGTPVETIIPDLGTAFYKRYIYQMFTAFIIDHIRQKRNNDVRRRITELAAELAAAGESPSMLISHLDEELKFTPKDKLRLFMQMSSMSFVEFVKQFELFSYDFDLLEFYQLQSMDINKLKTMLNQIAKQVTTDGIIKSDMPPQNIISIRQLNPYCKDGKLIIDHAILKDLIEILAMEIKNPWRFERLLTIRDITIDKMYFASRRGEKITITAL